MFNKEEVLKVMAQIIKSNNSYSSFHEYDLKQDELVFDEKLGCDFIWIVRENGTELVPLYRGFNPSLVTYLTNRGCNSFFLITCTGNLSQIEAAKAVELIMTPPFRLTSFCNDKALREKVSQLLNTPRLNTSIFEQNVLSFDDYIGWYDWFVKTKNHLMADVMNQVIARLS
ncbi:hypothetical protein H5185_15470 [Shewanella sp. SG44-6]|jgi:hypothetical protein|uniref:hypothetical protein n=1 Tax=Shewanella sp. SG44-6 TaxID=2760959 RepID=UPI0016043C8E|nr:hypothetical protein [Shewanella sp. SG44-6]MBB1390804.1 hypothetical protein [Shewanella sp. SG44-6]